jgi:hypothetical protein
MIERFSDNSLYWVFGGTCIALTVVLFGLISSRNLDKEQRKLKVRKFGLIGLGLWFCCLGIFKPHISSYSMVENLDHIKIENVETFGEINKRDAEQIRNIEMLKVEVFDLRNDLDRMNSYYSTVMQFASTMAAVACFTVAFIKKDS